MRTCIEIVIASIPSQHLSTVILVEVRGIPSPIVVILGYKKAVFTGVRYRLGCSLWAILSE